MIERFPRMMQLRIIGFHLKLSISKSRGCLGKHMASRFGGFYYNWVRGLYLECAEFEYPRPGELTFIAQIATIAQLTIKETWT